jgi:hypothetical protein
MWALNAKRLPIGQVCTRECIFSTNQRARFVIMVMAYYKQNSKWPLGKSGILLIRKNRKCFVLKWTTKLNHFCWNVERKMKEMETTTKQSEEASPLPKTADEWLAKMGFVSWPLRVEEENKLNLTPEDVGTGTLEDIINTLAAHAPLDLSILDEVLKQIEELEKKVYFYASKILNVEVQNGQ